MQLPLGGSLSSCRGATETRDRRTAARVSFGPITLRSCRSAPVSPIPLRAFPPLAGHQLPLSLSLHQSPPRVMEWGVQEGTAPGGASVRRRRQMGFPAEGASERPAGIPVSADAVRRWTAGHAGLVSVWGGSHSAKGGRRESTRGWALLLGIACSILRGRKEVGG